METLVDQANVSGLDLYLENGDHAAWDSFNDGEKMKLITEDLQAGRNVSIVFFASILLTIVAVVIVLRSS